ncbi:TPA: hypothetical protein H9559_002768 [Listeria monocytogenes]|nr:hypothetical protein [Listeria monocytogenes]HDU6829161.1 hypothetical protein [Listeria monocytogenes]
MPLKIIMDSGKECKTEKYETAKDLITESADKLGRYWFSIEDGSFLSFEYVSSVEKV